MQMIFVNFLVLHQRNNLLEEAILASPLLAFPWDILNISWVYLRGSHGQKTKERPPARSRGPEGIQTSMVVKFSFTIFFTT